MDAVERTKADLNRSRREDEMVAEIERLRLTDNDMFYLKSIKRNLDELAEISASMAEATGYGVANAALDDNRNWLDCFINSRERRGNA